MKKSFSNDKKEWRYKVEKYKILLVDDERSEREGVSFLIDKFGYPLEIKEASILNA